jgi:lipoprotein-anchoring transpeptidase ErfK/SrfK
MRAQTKRGPTALPAALALLVTVSLGAATAAQGAPAPRQEVAHLFSMHTARSAPDPHARALESVRALRPLTGERTALPVLGHKTAANGSRWLRVLLPGRPNGHAGWIEDRATTRTVTPWRIVVTTGNRRVTVYRRGRAVRAFKAVVGKPSTPTPNGRFFVEESIALRRGDVGGPFALALSARSTVLQEFDGGPGQIALHGLSNIGGVLGTAVSHGCIRLDNGAMRWLATRIGPGAPVTITG